MMDSEAQDRRRAAVFGATGGIGGALVRRLSATGWEVAAGARRPAEIAGASAVFAFDLADEDSIAAAASMLRAKPPECVIVATGALTLPDGKGPEKSVRQIDAAAMAEAFRLNTIGPALIAKHMLPLLSRERRSVFAVLGARVGSIGDNRLGGWHSYRASKAALAMLVRNFAIELARTHPEAIVVGLHPGTVRTGLSAPFVRGQDGSGTMEPATAAERLIAVIDALDVLDSGKVLDWRGSVVPP